jgi:hypothetical protein
MNSIMLLISVSKPDNGDPFHSNWIDSGPDVISRIRAAATNARTAFLLPLELVALGLTMAWLQRRGRGISH